METLLRFLGTFFKVLSPLSTHIADLSKHFPSSLYAMLKFAGVNKDDFTAYVVCPNSKCCAIYHYENCLEGSGDQRESKHCSAFVRTRRCNSQLMRKVHTRSGKVAFQPFKIYCYRSLKKSLADILNRPGILEECRKCHIQRNIESESLHDIYDGKVWKEFQSWNGSPLLSTDNCYGLMMNIDWFQPFGRVQYSMGAIYLSIMNLPRHLRFKQENILLVGLIPGPTEPKLSVNYFLKPLVDELLQFLDGVPLIVGRQQSPLLTHCVLLCVACDLPAARKECGFLSYSATVGCSRCYKQFPGAVGKKNYAGFDRTTWKPRSVSQHRKHVHQIETAKGSQQKNELITKHGCRYSELLRLPYFDPVRMTIIDPMHCLFLGISKYVLKRIWIEQALLNIHSFKHIETVMEELTFPLHLGRIPKNIFNCFGSFTADQMKNWTNMFSSFTLREVLLDEYWECWKHFVLASRIICQKNLSLTDVTLADALLLQFCRRLERVYSSDYITPNMHMACHLKECITDYGPLHTFWLFAFERYNGLIENMPCNNRMVEVQFMRRFLRDIKFSSLPLPDSLCEDFHSQFDGLTSLCSGSLLENEVTISQCDKNLTLPNQFVLTSFDSDMLSAAAELYMKIYPLLPIDRVVLPSCFRKYYTITLMNKKYYASKNLLRPNLYFVACEMDDSVATDFRPVYVEYFAVHTFHMENEVFTNNLARVKWLKCHPNRYEWGKPLQIWYKDDFEPDDSYGCFIPVNHLSKHCVYQIVKYTYYNVYLCTSTPT